MPKHYRPPGKKKEGTAARFITRNKALRRLQVSLPVFRKLCILKGIFLREPKKKIEGNQRAYYHQKDINFLFHEPLLGKFRELVGDQSSSESGKFTFLNCFDLGSGTLACCVKEGIKLYTYNIRSVHVEQVRQRATEFALNEALQEGLGTSAAAKQAQKAGAKAAKLASRKAKRIVGPIISLGWDFFEAICYGGTISEGFLRGSGTLFGTYIGGFHGEQKLGRLGYLTGSHLGSWFGGRIGLMFYDIVNGVNYLMNFVQFEDSYEQVKTENYEGDDSGYNEYSPENTEATTGGGWGLF